MWLFIANFFVDGLVAVHFGWCGRQITIVKGQQQYTIHNAMTHTTPHANTHTAPQVVSTFTLATDDVAALVCQLQHDITDDKQGHNHRIGQQGEICWLADNNQMVIGLWPVMSWTVQAICKHTKQLTVTSRCWPLPDVREATTQQLKTQDLTQTLLDYIEPHRSASTSKTVDNEQFSGGLMGFIGYDFGANMLSSNRGNISSANQPLAFLAHYAMWLQPASSARGDLNGSDNKITWVLYAESNTPDALIEHVSRWVTTSIDKLCSSPPVSNNLPSIGFRPAWTFAQYLSSYEQVQSHLQAGNSYQINLTQPWQGHMPKKVALVDYLPVLHAATNAPFAGYVSIDGFELLSCSPELFLTFKQTDTGIQVLTKPIKGTRPRGKTALEDRLLKDELSNSSKDRAENVMIVDLLRNDLGRFAKTGSVSVPALFEVESFRNVHHLVSTICADLADGVHALDVLLGSLPAGSITGTPKKRSVDIISDIECEPRGAYCGNMGYLNFDGSGQWNVLIRSVQKQANGEVRIWAGGGVTVSSTAKAEYKECLDKVDNLLNVFGCPSNTHSSKF